MGIRCQVLFLAMALLQGCTPPLLRQAEPAEIHTGTLAFLAGETNREEVLLRLGTPSAHFEGARILSYAYVRTSGGAWVRVDRYLDRDGQKFEYLGKHICNLVLVFAADGRLVRHSLVVSE
jgi:outer membrane protein assembly factor BamE (lipoprotein component of BamABCDE complex)